MSQPQGRIITFYSYKGGTGRSMVLANVAWILASNGKRVLTVDWDLEAPGLHRYFYPFLMDKDLTFSNGVINFVLDYKLKAMTPPQPNEKVPDDWYVSQANILRYASALKWDFPLGGRLDFVPAGRQDPTYSDLVNSFDWQEFYEHLGGGKFLDAAKQHMRRNYDYVLIDSRTGVSDTSGICTLQLPDDLVVCYTLNNQSIRGASTVAAMAAAARGEGLRVYPVAMRVEPNEQDKLESRRQFASECFGPFPAAAHLRDLGLDSDSYRARVQVPYIPYYAYEEVLATFGNTVPPTSGTLLESIERITACLFGAGFKAVSIPEGLRQRVLADFRGESPEPLVEHAEQTLEHLSPEDREIAKRIFTRLVRLAGRDEQGEDKPVPFNLRELDVATRRVVNMLVEAGVLTLRHDETRFAKDAFVRSWQRLREWLDDDREFLLWRQGLSKIAADWRGVRDRALLRRGSELEADINWLRRRKPDLLPMEIEYIEAGRRSRRMRRAQMAGAAILLVLFLAVGYGLEERRWKPAPLHRFPPSGNGVVTFTPVSSEVLVTSGDSKFKIWNAKSTVFLPLPAGFQASPRGEFLFNADPDVHRVTVVQSASQSQYSIELKPNETAGFDQTGRFLLISGSQPGRTPREYIRVWNLASNQQAGELILPPSPSPNGLLLPPLLGLPGATYVTADGRHIIGQIGLWDVPDGRLLSELTSAQAPSVYGPYVVNEKASWLATLVLPGLSLLGAPPPPPERVELWDLKTGRKLSRADLPHATNDPIWSLDRLSTNGTFLFLSGFSAGQNKGAVLNTSDFRLAASCPRAGLTVQVSGQMGATNAVVCSDENSPDYILWDAGSDRPTALKSFSPVTLQTGVALFASDDRKRLIALRESGHAELWNFMSGQKIRDLDLTSPNISGDQLAESRAAAANFTMDGGAVSVRLESGAIMLFSTDTGERIGVLENADGKSQEIYYDAACRRASVWTDKGSVLRYTEGKTFFGLFLPSRWGCGQ